MHPVTANLCSCLFSRLLVKKRGKKSTGLKFEAQRTVVSQLWANNIQKPAEIIRLTGFPKSTMYDLVNRLKERSIVTLLPIPGIPPIHNAVNLV